jgi:hypothetical protein
VKLGSQETRNAVYGGLLNSLCLALSENEKFRRMWGIPLDPSPEEKEADEETRTSPSTSPTKAGKRMFEKMEDVELVLRFFAYRQIDSSRLASTRSPSSSTGSSSEGNNFPATLLAKYRTMFESTVGFLWDVLGAEAFTVLGSSKRGPPRSSTIR